MVSTFIFFLLGGLAALLVRTAAGAARGTALPARGLQPDLHHARHGDDLPVHHPVRRRRPRQLLRAADDRRARHGVSQDQRAVVLDDPAGRAADSVRLLLPDPTASSRPARRCGLDLVSAAQRARAVRPEPVAGRRHHPGHLVDPRLDELPGHHPEHAHAGHDHAPPAAVRVGHADHVVHPAHRHAGPGGGAADGPGRPPPRHALLRSRRRR